MTETWSAMKRTVRSPIPILIAGTAVIALALLLFVNAMIIADFAPPGRDPFQGRSIARLAIAFLLLTGLAGTLLVAIFRTGRPAGNASARKAASTRVKTPAGAAHHAGAGDGNAEGSVGILSETAGELRSTVGVIQDELDEILDDEAPADREHMQSLYEETDRLKKIIDSMEQLSRVQMLARPDRKGSLLLEPLLQEIVETTRQAVTGRDVTYRLECEAGLSMKGDPECVSLIIRNIAENAARSIQGSGSVTLTAARRGAMVVFSVQDTGTGIRRAHRAHIYERFFRGTGSGVGMGLSIAKELVDACEGAIEVQTELNKGTTFTVQLPAE